MCIYLKFGNELTYKKKEHVIPAALGGKIMLPIGTVSDQVNELFSKSELIATRETLLSISRENVGPGKRGSRSVKKIKNPRVRMLEVMIEKEKEKPLIPFKLGFIHYGEAYVIPQFYIKLKEDNSIGIPVYHGGFFGVNINEFIKKLIILSEDLSNLIFIESELKISENFLSIGNFENKGYLYTNISGFKTENFIQIVKIFGFPKWIPEEYYLYEKYHYSYKLAKAMDDSYIFIYLKTAFNFLALIMGEKFVMQKQFDDLRDAIINKCNLNEYVYNKPIPLWLKKWAFANLNFKQHLVVISLQKNYIVAYVGFYSESPGVFKLGRNDEDIILKKAIICDWENGEDLILDIKN